MFYVDSTNFSLEDALGTFFWPGALQEDPGGACCIWAPQERLEDPEDPLGRLGGPPGASKTRKSL